MSVGKYIRMDIPLCCIYIDIYMNMLWIMLIIYLALRGIFSFILSSNAFRSFAFFMQLF